MIDRGQLGTEPTVVTALVLLAAVALLLAVFGHPTDPAEVGDFREQAESWCADHGGDLTNSMVVGSHGGLHCDLGDRTVHMSAVADAGWPANASAVPDHDAGLFSGFGVLLLIPLAGLGAFSVVWVGRRIRTKDTDDGSEDA